MNNDPSNNPYSVGSQLDGGGTTPQASVRSMQIVASALMAGVLFFAAIVAVVTGSKLNGQPDVLTWMGGAFAAVAVVIHFVLPPMIAKKSWERAIANGLRQKSESEQIQHAMNDYQCQLIVGHALLEGAAFMNLTVLIAGRSVINLGVVIALLVLMLIRFPTTTKVTWWIQDRLRQR